MIAPRSLAVTLLLGSALGISCYSEQLPPSTYRYACDGDAGCSADEVCRRGLCERPCTQLTALDDCPLEAGYAACFNGVCASTCGIGGGYCPSAYECIDLGIDAGGGSPFGGSSEPVGICGLACDDQDNADLCPTGEICIAAFGTCAVDCSAGQACPAGYVCFFGVCGPEGTELPGGDSGGESGAADPGEGEVPR